MKRIIVLYELLIFSACILAQAPDKLSYQAVVRDASGNLLTNKAIGMTVSILQGSESGTEVYKEIFDPNPQTNGNGLITTEIGSGIPVTGNFAEINWADGPHFIKTEIDPAGGTSYTITVTSQILSVPYALYAKTAENGLTAGNQNIDGNKAFAETIVANKGLDVSNNNIINVADPVGDQDAANKAYVDALKENIFNELLDAGLNGIIKDVEGNSYKTIKIGNQVWMAENLKTKRLNNGKPILKISDKNAWRNTEGLKTPAYCWYNNDSATFAKTYGPLYNWYAVGTDSLCPAGWHVPDTSEFRILYMYLGGAAIAGGKLKESDTLHWSPNVGGTNESGFTALPGGIRYHDFFFSNDIVFSSLGRYSEFWTSTLYVHDLYGILYFYFYIYNESSSIDRGASRPWDGLSVRCLKN